SEQPIFGQSAGRLDLIQLLVGGREAVERERERLCGIWDGKLGQLLGDHQLVPSVLCRKAITECDPVVVVPKGEFPSSTTEARLAQSHDGLGAKVGDFAPFAWELVIRLAPRPGIDRRDLARTAQRGPVSKTDAEPGWTDDFLVPEEHAIMRRRFSVCSAS